MYLNFSWDVGKLTSPHHLGRVGLGSFARNEGKFSWEISHLQLGGRETKVPILDHEPGWGEAHERSGIFRYFPRNSHQHDLCQEQHHIITSLYLTEINKTFIYLWDVGSSANDMITMMLWTQSDLCCHHGAVSVIRICQWWFSSCLWEPFNTILNFMCFFLLLVVF